MGGGKGRDGGMWWGGEGGDRGVGGRGEMKRGKRDSMKGKGGLEGER